MAFLLGECLLQDHLNRKGMSQSEFARRMGCSRQFVSQLIAGKAFMSLEFAINAAYILECKPTDFYILETGKRKQRNRKE
ncbi:transcriptional regulator [Paenibacillus thailandensis]|uniref:Transcriptional regulator n=1 Tax=Paenibacillus thailandensis TaxID=393250 RepID=A0ABW5QT64_9BACL